MAIHIERGEFDEERGRFRYFVCFTKDGISDDEIRARVPVEVSLSISENGDVADLAFQLPKACRDSNALALIERAPEARAVESRVFITRPGLSGDAVINSAAELHFDAAGRIIGMAIHPF